MGCKKWIDFNNKRFMPVSRFPRANSEGQALIEFVLALMIIISLFFFYVKLAAVFAIGNFIHYATFMSARALSSSATTPDQQVENAESVIRTYVGGRWKSFIKPKGGGAVPGVLVGPGPYYLDNPGLDVWNQGVTYTFDAQFSLYPWTPSDESLTVGLRSESWMAREESEAETQAKKDRVQGLLQNAVRGSAVIVEWDNGY